MKDQLTIPMESPGRRAAAYWFADGLEEIVFGLTLVVSGAAGLLWGTYVPRRWMGLSWVGPYAGTLVYFFMRRRVLGFLKSRTTYPRTGYVQQPEEIDGFVWGTRYRSDEEPLLNLLIPPYIGARLTLLSLRPDPPAKENATAWGWRTGLVFLLFLGMLVIPVGGGLSDGSPAPRLFVPGLMAALAATLYVVNRRSERPYRWWSTLVLGLMGLPLLWVDVPGFVQAWSPMLLGGAWLAAIGSSTLIQYLRANPYPRVAEGART